MTEQEWIELGRRAVACRGWRWLPGMLEFGGVRANGEQYGGSVWVEHCGGGYEPVNGWVPDLRDPATVGCLLALVREAHGDVSGGPVPVTAADRGDTSGGPPVWFVVWSHGPCGDPFNRAQPTEAHALVAALEFER